MKEKYFLESEGVYPICIQYIVEKQELLIGGHNSLRDNIEYIVYEMLDPDEEPELIRHSNKFRIQIIMTYKAFRRFTRTMRDNNYELQWTTAFNRAM